MGPKVEAAIDFVRHTGGWAAIGSLQDASKVIAGEAGTTIRGAMPDYRVAFYEETDNL